MDDLQKLSSVDAVVGTEPKRESKDVHKRESKMKRVLKKVRKRGKGI